MNFNPLTKNRFASNFRYRLDERFIHLFSGNELTAGYRFVLRHRLRAQILYHLDEKKQATIKLADEMMLNTTEDVDVFDQNRIYASIEFQLSKSISVESGYLHQYVLRNGEYTTFHVLRTTLYHRLALKRSNF